MRNLVYLAFFILISPGLQAQEIKQDSSSEQEVGQEQISLKQAQDKESLQMSPLPAKSQEQDILALAPFTQDAPGVCLVISAMLVDFCKTNPKDSSCTTPQ